MSLIRNGKLRKFQELQGYGMRKRSKKSKERLLTRLDYDAVQKKVDQLSEINQPVDFEEYVNRILNAGPKAAFRLGVLDTPGWRRGYTK